MSNKKESMADGTSIETIKNDQYLNSYAHIAVTLIKRCRPPPSFLSKVSRHQFATNYRAHQPKTKDKSITVIHTKIGSSTTPTSKNRNKKTNDSCNNSWVNDSQRQMKNAIQSRNNKQKKSKTIKKCQAKVTSYNDDISRVSSRLDDPLKTKTMDGWSSGIRSTAGLHDIVEHTKKRKKLKTLYCFSCPCSPWCLLGFLFVALLLILLLAILLVKLLPTTSTTSTFISTTTMTTTTETVTTTTTRPSGALSIYAIVTASYFNPTGGSSTAQADGLVDRQPNGAAFVASYAPQYVQLELSDVYNISNVCLLIAQSPNGVTHHQLSVGASLNSTQIVNDLNGTTYNGEWINITYNPPLNDVRFLRLATISSPSWVSWVKFLVYGV